MERLGNTPRPARISSAVATLVAAWAPSCAAVISKSSYAVFIDSTPRDAAFVIHDEDGNQVHVGTTPETVALESGAGSFDAADYTVTFGKAGHEEHCAQLDGRLDPWYFGNLLFPGLLGFLLDPLFGGMWRLDRRVLVSLAPTSP